MGLITAAQSITSPLDQKKKGKTDLAFRGEMISFQHAVKRFHSSAPGSRCMQTCVMVELIHNFLAASRLLYIFAQREQNCFSCQCFLSFVN